MAFTISMSSLVTRYSGSSDFSISSRLAMCQVFQVLLRTVRSPPGTLPTHRRNCRGVRPSTCSAPDCGAPAGRGASPLPDVSALAKVRDSVRPRSMDTHSGRRLRFGSRPRQRSPIVRETAWPKLLRRHRCLVGEVGTLVGRSSRVLTLAIPTPVGEQGFPLGHHPMVQLNRPNVVVVAEVKLQRAQATKIARAPPIDRKSVNQARREKSHCSLR